MSRYIDAEKLINKIDALCINNQDVMFIRQLVTQLETEDVAPVVHAQWLHVVANIYDCSNCFGGLEIPWEGEIADYVSCPYCGAKMDGKDGE